MNRVSTYFRTIHYFL